MTYHTPELVLVGSAQGLVLGVLSSAADPCPFIEADLTSRNDKEF